MMAFRALGLVLFTLCGICQAALTTQEALYKLEATDRAPVSAALSQTAGDTQSECALGCLMETRCTAFTWSSAEPRISKTFTDAKDVTSSPGDELYTKQVRICIRC